MGRLTAAQKQAALQTGGAIAIRQGHIDALTCPAGKQQHFLWDTEIKGFGVRVSQNGSKSYIYKGNLDASSGYATFRETLGSTVLITLEQARELAKQVALSVIETGMSPQQQRDKAAQDEAQRVADAERKAEQERQRAATIALAEQKALEHAQQHTLAELCRCYWEHLEKQGKTSAQEARNFLRRYIVGSELGDTPANQVTDEQISDLLRGMVDDGLTRTVGSVRSYLLAAFNLAKRARLDADVPLHFKGFAVRHNPVADVPVPKVGKVASSTRTLDRAELREYLLAVEAMPAGVYRDIMLAQLLTGGQRFAQLGRAKRQDYDPATATLTLFDAKGKRSTPRTHILPLAPKAAELFRQLDEQATHRGTEWLFPAITDRTLPIDSGNVSAEANSVAAGMLKAETVKAAFQARDIRRTVETMLAGAGVSKDLRAQLQSHGLSGVQAAHYDRHEYMDEKRQTLGLWERLLETARDNTEARANVVTLQRQA